MAKLKFLDSYVFRLALGYTAMVVSVISLVFIFSYAAADRLLNREMRAAIETESDNLSRRYRLAAGDPAAEPNLAAALSEILPIMHARDEASEDAFYQLYRPAAEGQPARKLADGAFKIDVLQYGQPDEGGWIHATLPPSSGPGGSGRARRVTALQTTLDSSLSLVVGRDRNQHRSVKDTLFRMMLSGLGVTTALGLLGGAVSAQRMMRRVERARRAAQDIMTGDLKRRLPLVGYDDELERLTITLNQMLDRIERLVEAMREVTDDVAHDLRTPLTRLRARAERALRQPSASQPELRAALDECVQEADRLLAVFRAILSIARLKTRRGACDEHPEIDLSQAVADAGELYEPVLEEAGFALKLDIAPDLRIRGERALIGQAVANLIENALHYGLPPEGSGRRPEVTLRLARRGDRAEISVADRGPGVPPDKREAVFSRFSRLDPSRAEEGVGLGLAFVRAVAESHGGSSRIEDAGPGARVVVALPASQGEA
ncbi:HAMP domain-containing sensor histidine kinase [Neomegalonema sp.]|uniref:sensor histidine kinase n=1 Tax=Neomegalonema sp. TaxID=2039713 RepID=UPI00261E6655|nr:HAMP domain-containing sensor histidine kinase [Neomegalonema sp.]MDD2869546.1 HAMP domain-containing sensor histidine kinase [Neomegalonema sp.]